MSKAVVCAFLATAFVLLLVLLSTHSQPKLKGYGPHARIRRLGFKRTSPIFDPIIAKVQRIEEEKASNTNGSHTSHLEPQDEKYFNDDGTLNLRLRLLVLFPILGRIPQDGVLEPKELEVWLTQQAIDRLHYRTHRELQLLDKDGDGAISFSEYLPQLSEEDIERNETEHGEAGWWMEQFRNADVDRNGTLNLYEFRDFLHPEDSRNEHIQKWLLREKIRNIDEDHDERLNYDEFWFGVYNTYRIYLEYESSGGGDYIPTAAEVFTKLDVDKDRVLRAEELKPLRGYLCPREFVYAKHYATYLIREADDNGDGKLSLDEMLNHEHNFFSTVSGNGKEDDQDIIGNHDEL